MTKKLVTFLFAFLLPVTAAHAKPIPQWVDTLAETEGLDREATCVALGVYYESRGESVRGQRAVASVIMNRVRSGRFADTACEVLFQPKQFSFLNGGKVLAPKGASWTLAKDIGREFVTRDDTENKYLFFSGEGYLRGTRIGNHIFR